jgi:hypothetical protein
MYALGEGSINFYVIHVEIGSIQSRIVLLPYYHNFIFQHLCN